MKVLHVIKLDPRAPGGIERFADELMTAQVDAGHEVHAVGCDVAQTPRLPEPKYRLALARTWFTLFHLPVAPAFPRLVRQEIARLAPDVVHVHWPNPLVLDLAPAIPRLSRLVVHWQSDIDPDAASLPIRVAYRARVRACERRLLERCDAVIATSRSYFAGSRTLQQVAAKVHVVPLAIGNPPAPATPVDWPLEGGPRILFVGRAVPYKTLDVLLAALVHVPRATLVVVGSGPSLAGWKSDAARLGIGARVAFAGSVDEATKLGLLAACDALCLPSSNRLESFGVVQLEAAAAGRRVIAADIPGSGVGDVARALPGGTTFPPGDVRALADAIEALGAPADPVPTLPPQFRIAAVAAEVEWIYRSLPAPG